MPTRVVFVNGKDVTVEHDPHFVTTKLATDAKNGRLSQLKAPTPEGEPERSIWINPALVLYIQEGEAFNVPLPQR